MQIMDIILITLFVEAVVNAIKPLWSEAGGLSISEWVSAALGIVIAVTCKINMLSFVVTADYPQWVSIGFCALTGIAIGRGTNFVYDLWEKLKMQQSAADKVIMVSGDAMQNEQSIPRRDKMPPVDGGVL